MAITRKPADEQDYEAYLRKGGSAASPEPGAPKKVRFTLELPGDLCQALDELRRRRPGKISRHQWVVEAVAQRIQRDAEAEAGVRP